MIEAIFIGLLLLIVAFAAWQFVPPPFGTIVGAFIALLALYVIVRGVLGDGTLSH